MSISKLCGGKSVLGRWQYENVSSEIQKCDEPAAAATIKLAKKNLAAVNGLCASSSSSSPSTTTTTTTKVSSSPVAANEHNNAQLQPQQQQQQQQQQPQPQQQKQQTFLPQTSLLKIRPFVPSLNARLRRPIGRSYSTLTSSYARRTLSNSVNNNINNNNSNNHNNNNNNNNNNNSNAIVTITPSKPTTAITATITATATTTTTTTTTTIATTANGNWSHITTRKEAVTKHESNIVLGAAIERNRCVPVYPKGPRPFGNFARRQTIKVITHQRSKSTSSSAASTSASIRPTTATAAAAAAASSSSASTATTTTTSVAVNGNHGAAQNASMVAAIVTPQPNGICRIARVAGEQEKLPDRINYDRRGLTAIPIFENEPNLRLLSLQHNLINVFHIPKSDAVEDNGAPSSTTFYRHQKPPAILDDPAARENVQHQSHCHRAQQIAGLVSSSFSSLQQQQIGTATAASLSSPPVQSPSSSLSQHSNYGGSQQFPKRDNLLQSLNLSINASLMLGTPNKQQQFQLQQHHHHHHHQRTQKPLQRQSTLQHYRFAMKKSKSFINNYSRQGNSAKRNVPMKPPFHKGDSKMLMLLGGRTNLRSFDSGTSPSGSGSGSGIGIGSASALTTATAADSLSTMVASELDEEDAYRQQLEIKNRQLHPIYGAIFQNLVFLDLYDNQIERIANLDGLPVLSVLLLGKNRITDLSGLMSLKSTLRVLDLHGNKITSIGNKINCLQGLKSLNLAGNQIRQINQNDFNGLQSLKELNLKRNRIRRINGFQHLVVLERLWLCHNDVHKVEDMSSIARAINLLEVTIENNPVSLAGDCVSYLVSHLPNLVSLSQMPITDQVRRAAMAWRRNKELSEASRSTSNSSDVFNHIRREEVISNARTNWELLRSQQTMQAALKWGGEQRASPKQRELTKINESNETAVGYEDLQEYIKLPPIQKRPMSGNGNGNNNRNQQFQDEQKDADRLSRSSNSSLGPNVDSSSSSYSSDNEETPKKHNEKEENRSKKPHQQRMPKSTRRKEEEKPARESRSHKAEHYNENENENEKEFPRDTARGGEDSTSGAEQGQTLLENQTSSGKITERTMTNGSAKSCELMNSNTPLLEATTGDGCCNGASNLQQRTPTSVTAITSSSSSNLLCLGYDLENASGIGSGADCEAIAVAKTITAPSPMATTTTPGATTTTSAAATATTTAATTATCRRYMRGSLMRSQVVVGGVGCYSSNVGYASAAGGVGAAGAGAVGGKLRLASRNIVAIVNNQLNVNSNGAVEAVTAAQTPTPTATPLPVATPKTPPMDCANNSATTTPSSNCPNASVNVPTAPPTSNTVAATATAAAPVTVAPTTKLTALEREREQGGDYLIEICGRYLNIYGQGALRFIDKQWNPTKANDVHTLNFSYINFNNIVAVLSRIKVRFPRAEHFVFRETNICCLGQLNALAELQGITSLFIDPEGNAITTKVLWRQYAIYRLSHWGLKLLNGSEISATEIDEANEMYAGLSDLVLWSMPDVMLHPLLARLRLEETCTASKMSPKDWLMKPENKSLRLVVGKEALQWKKPTANANANASLLGNGHVNSKTPTSFSNACQQAGSAYTYNNNSSNNNGQQHQQHQQSYGNNYGNGNSDLMDPSASGETGAHTAAGGAFTVSPNSMALSARERARMHFTAMMENTCNAIEKLHKLETLWPSLLLDIVRNTLLDYSQLDAYLRNLMADIMK